MGGNEWHRVLSRIRSVRALASPTSLYTRSCTTVVRDYQGRASLGGGEGDRGVIGGSSVWDVQAKTTKKCLLDCHINTLRSDQEPGPSGPRSSTFSGNNKLPMTCVKRRKYACS